VPAKKYLVSLTEEERKHLQQLIGRGKPAARTVTRARILLKADAGCSDGQIVAALSTSLATVERVRQRCVEEGVESALKGGGECLERACAAGFVSQAQRQRRSASHCSGLYCTPFGTCPLEFAAVGRQGRGIRFV
jgi:Homeodomain-like domain